MFERLKSRLKKLIDIGLCLLSRDMGNKVWTVLRILGFEVNILVNQLDTNIDVHNNVEKRRNSLYYSYGFYSILGKKHISCHEYLPERLENLRREMFFSIFRKSIIS